MLTKIKAIVEYIPRPVVRAAYDFSYRILLPEIGGITPTTDGTITHMGTFVHPGSSFESLIMDCALDRYEPEIKTMGYELDPVTIREVQIFE